MKTDYEILGVPKTATPQEIRKAFIRASFLLHPDRNPSKTGEYQEVVEAYKRLQNPTTSATNNSGTLLLGGGFARILRGDVHDQFDTLLIEDSPFNIFYNNEIDPAVANDQQIRPLSLTLSQDYSATNWTLKTISKDLTQDILDLDVNIVKNYNVDLPFFDQAVLKTLAFVDARYTLTSINQTAVDYPDLPFTKAFLWHAEKENWGSIYLVSTAHRECEYEDLFGCVIDQAIANVDVVFTEIEVHLIVDKKIAVPDCYIATVAYEMGKTLKPLESRFIYEIIKQRVGADNELGTLCPEDLITQYLTHIAPSDCIQTRAQSVILRNKFWMESILAISDTRKKSLVACGSSHNVGKWGLPMLLASEGFKLTPIIQKPYSRKESLRQLVFGTPGLTFFGTQQKISEDLDREYPIHSPEGRLTP